MNYRQIKTKANYKDNNKYDYIYFKEKDNKTKENNSPSNPIDSQIRVILFPPTASISKYPKEVNDKAEYNSIKDITEFLMLHFSSVKQIEEEKYNEVIKVRRSTKRNKKKHKHKNKTSYFRHK